MNPENLDIPGIEFLELIEETKEVLCKICQVPSILLESKDTYTWSNENNG